MKCPICPEPDTGIIVHKDRTPSRYCEKCSWTQEKLYLDQVLVRTRTLNFELDQFERQFEPFDSWHMVTDMDRIMSRTGWFRFKERGKNDCDV